MTLKVTGYPNLSRKQYRSYLDELTDDSFKEMEERYQFRGLNEEPVICNHFGCSKHLSLMEQLYGNKCIKHQNNKPYIYLFKL